MTTVKYQANSADVTKDLYNANVANMTGNVTHTIGGTILENSTRSRKIADAVQAEVHVSWSGFSVLTTVLEARTRAGNAEFVNENSDETSSNPTQVTLSTASGSKILHFAPANYEDFQLFYDKKTAVAGTITVTVLFKF